MSRNVALPSRAGGAGGDPFLPPRERERQGLRVGWIAAAAVALWLVQTALTIAGDPLAPLARAAVAWCGLAILPALPFLIGLSRGDLDGLKLILLLLAFSPLVAASLAAGVLLAGGTWDLVVRGLPPALAAITALMGWARRGQRVRVSPGRGPAWLAGASLAGALLILFPALSSPVARASFHGYLHTSIAYAVLERGLPVENPFYAGEPLPYYWIFHTFGALLAKAAGMVPLDAFTGWNLQALAVVLPWLALVASPLHDSFRKQALGGVVALLGLNALGWIVFLPRVFALADRLGDLAQPLHLLDLLAMGWDSRINAPLTKFCNISSFPASFVLVLVYLYATGKVIERSRTPWAWVSGAALAGATALSPHLGGFVAAASLAGLGLIGGWGGRRGRWGAREADLRRGAVRASLLTLVAIVCVLPYLVPILRAFHLEAVHPAAHPGLAARLWEGMGPLLLPLALVVPILPRAIRERDAARLYLLVLGLALLAGHAAVTLPEDTQYKVVRLAAVPFGLLAGEAAGRLAFPSPGHGAARRVRLWGALLLAVLLLPTSLAARWVYGLAAARPSLVAWQPPWLVPRPDTDPKAPFYAYLQDHAPADAIVVVDPRLRRRHGAGRLQGSEVVLYARRGIYTDRANYLTEGYPDFPARKALVERLYAQGPEAGEIDALRAMDRPVYLIRTPGSPREAWDRSRALACVVDRGAWGLYRLRGSDGEP